MRKPNVGFVYVIQMEGFPVYKIGRSVDLPKRLSQIGIQLPFPYRLVYAYRVPDVELFERKIHDILADSRMNGEWFLLTECHLERTRYFLLSAQAAHQIDAWNYAIEHVADAPRDMRERVANTVARLTARMMRRSRLASSYHAAHRTQTVEAGGVQ